MAHTLINFVSIIWCCSLKRVKNSGNLWSSLPLPPTNCQISGTASVVDFLQFQDLEEASSYFGHVCWTTVQSGVWFFLYGWRYSLFQKWRAVHFGFQDQWGLVDSTVCQWGEGVGTYHLSGGMSSKFVCVSIEANICTIQHLPVPFTHHHIQSL